MAGSDKQRGFDVAIIGAGVIGCAIARRFALEGARALVLERGHDVLDGASKGNSGILHTGFDTVPGSLEHALVACGHEEYLTIHERLGLPLIRSGALVLAWTEDEEARLPLLMDKARENGVLDVAPLTAGELQNLEPNLSTKVRAGFSVPREFIIDPWSAPHAYLLQALANGAELLRDCEVSAGRFDGAAWHLETPAGPVVATTVINAAGLYGDLVDEMLTGESTFHIRPRKGQFVVYDKPAAGLVRNILLPVPTEKTKGVVVCRTAFGNVLVGPTAEDQDDRERAELVPERLAALMARGKEIVPELARVDVTAIYAGLRPASEYKDYQIRLRRELNLITVGGIRSTGLSSALGTARYVFELYRALGHLPEALADPVWPSIAVISESGERDWQESGNGGIVCHCEKVTRREIERVLEGPLAPQSFAGLKRQTRVTMGRCQGFYCSAELARITQGRLRFPMTGAPHDE